MILPLQFRIGDLHHCQLGIQGDAMAYMRVMVSSNRSTLRPRENQLSARSSRKGAPVLPASLCLSPSPPLARRSRNAMPSRPPQPLSRCCAHTRCSHPRPEKARRVRGDCHEVSILIRVGDGERAGGAPSKVSTMIIRPPQRGQRRPGEGPSVLGSSKSHSVSAGERSGAASAWRTRSMLRARTVPANKHHWLGARRAGQVRHASRERLLFTRCRGRARLRRAAPTLTSGRVFEQVSERLRTVREPRRRAKLLV